MLAFPSLASAQEYRFPVLDTHWDHFYPTAYKDHDGTDWNCGTIRYGGHRGSDFGGGGFAGMDAGRDIVAAADGVVASVHDGEFDRCTTSDCAGGGGFGNHVRITHADGKTTIYAHLKQFSVAVTEGQSVTCGTLLGQMGSSGFSSGPHLHFEVRAADNVAHDPFDGACSSPPTYWVDQWHYDDRPLPHCAGARPACEPVDLVTCGAAIDARNDDVGSTASHFVYGCDKTFAYTGSEMAWRFATDRDEAVTVDVGGLSADVDLYVLAAESCDPTTCIAASTNTASEPEQLAFDAVAGTEYIIVADGFEGAATDLSLGIQCAGGLPDGTGTEPDAGVPDEPVPDAGPTGPSNDDDGATVTSGCNSSGRAPSLPGALVLLAFGLALRRRFG